MNEGGPEGDAIAEPFGRTRRARERSQLSECLGAKSCALGEGIANAGRMDDSASKAKASIFMRGLGRQRPQMKARKRRAMAMFERRMEYFYSIPHRYRSREGRVVR